MKTIRRFTVVLALVTIAGVINTGVAMAAPPPNDTEATAVAVEAVPFTHSTDTTEATPDGPSFCSNSASAFYRFTPAEDVRLQVDLLGSEYDTTLGVYTRDAGGRVQEVACNDDRLGYDAGVRMRAKAGTTYYFMVGRCCRSGRSGGGPLVFTVSHVVTDPLVVSLSFADTGTVDAEGVATISGTFTCNKRSRIWAEGVLRQLRQEIFIARGYWYHSGACTPEAPLTFVFQIDSGTSVAFGPGTATGRLSYSEAYAGWRDWTSDYDGDTVEPITLS